MGFLGKAVAGLLVGGTAYALGKNANSNDETNESTQAPQAQELKTDLPQDEPPQNEPIFKQTNIAYYDEKLKSGKPLTLLEARAFKEATGKDISEYGDQSYKIDMNAKINQKKDFNTLAELKAANYLLDESIAKSNGNLGLGGAVDRWAHHASGKFFNMNDKNAQFELLHREAVIALARAQKKGRLSNQDEKRVEHYYGLGAMRDNYYEKMFVVKQKLAEDMRQELISLHKQGRAISEDDKREFEKVLNSLNVLKSQIDSINNNGKKFDYKMWSENFLSNRRDNLFNENTPMPQNNSAQTQTNRRSIYNKNTQNPQENAKKMVIFGGIER